MSEAGSSKGGGGWGSWLNSVKVLNTVTRTMSDYVMPTLETTRDIVKEAAADIGQVGSRAIAMAKEAAKDTDKALESVLGAVTVTDDGGPAEAAATPARPEAAPEAEADQDDQEHPAETEIDIADDEEDKGMAVLHALDKGFTFLDKQAERLSSAVIGSVGTVKNRAAPVVSRIQQQATPFVDLVSETASNVHLEDLSQRTVEGTKKMVDKFSTQGIEAISAVGQTAFKFFGGQIPTDDSDSDEPGPAAPAPAPRSNRDMTRPAQPIAPSSTASASESESATTVAVPVAEEGSADWDFDRWFEKTSGPQFVKTLQRLSDDCSAACDRAVAAVGAGPQVAVVEAASSTLELLFKTPDVFVNKDIPAELSATLTGFSSDLSRECQASEQGRQVLALAREGRDKANSFPAQFVAQLSRVRQSLGVAEGAVVGADKAAAVVSAAVSAIDGIRTESIRRLAGFAAAALTQLEKVATSITQPAAEGSVVKDRSGAEAAMYKAALARRWSQFLSDEISSLASSFMSSVRQVATSAKVALGKALSDSQSSDASATDANVESIDDKMYGVTTDIFLESGNATTVVQSAVKSLHSPCRLLLIQKLIPQT